MDHSVQSSCRGMLPSDAPLAEPFVPFQPNDPNRYEAKAGLIRGTLFPCLDLPFLGMVNTEEKSDTPMHDLQALGFAVQELGLYLDTHADDAEAAELYERYANLYKAGMKRYAEQCGALRQTGSVVDGTYTWTQGPWPWEIAANGEG